MSQYRIVTDGFGRFIVQRWGQLHGSDGFIGSENDWRDVCIGRGFPAPRTFKSEAKAWRHMQRLIEDDRRSADHDAKAAQRNPL